MAYPAENIESQALNIWRLRDEVNIEPLLDEEESKKIGREVVQGFEADLQSRVEWDKRMENAVKLALQIKEAKSWPWPNASNVKFPLVTIAALQFSARAYPALVKSPDLVKYRVNGADPDGEKAAKASRISRHMSYQLLQEDEDWEEDFDRGLIALPILGTMFKKSYFDPVKQHNVSKLVLPQDLYVNYYARSIEDCERKTEVFELSGRQIKERQARGVYSDKEFKSGQIPKPPLSDNRQGISPPAGKRPPQFLEQHKFLDLDGDGYEEPYVVTVDKNSGEVARIVSRFAEIETKQSIQMDRLKDRITVLEEEIKTLTPPRVENPTEQQIQALEEVERQIVGLRQEQTQLAQQIQALDQDNQQNPQVICVKAEEHYTKYGFIPSPDGGFYDLGLGALLGPINDSVNTLINQLIDAGTMNVGSHGFIGRGARIKGGRLEFEGPFEWIKVGSSGQSLRDNIVPLPVNEPSNVLFQLLSLLINYGERVASVNDVMTGQNPGQNTPAYSYQAMLEQGLQVFNGIFKRTWRSMRKEFKKLYVMNRTYLNPVEYFETLDGRFQVLQNDYKGDEKDVYPAADPNAFSNMENLMKAHFLAERAATVPHYNPVKVEMLLLEAMDVPDAREVYPLDDQGQPVIPAPSNPEIEIKAMDLQRKTAESDSRQETNALLAASKVDLDRSTALLNQFKAGKISSDILVDEFQAITDRMKVRGDIAMKSLEEARNERESRRSESSGDG